MPAHRVVVQAGVVGGHLRRVVVEDPADDLLRDVTVDQPGAEGMTPLMRREMHPVAVFVADAQASSQRCRAIR